MLSCSSSRSMFFLILFSASSALAGGARPADWGQPMHLPGVPNLHKIDDQLYRGAQPSAEGMRNLKKLGIRTVISLRWLHSDRDELEGIDMNYVHIPIRTWKLKEKHVLRFLQTVLAEGNRPVYFHCQHGADRTGTMAAFYRLVVQGWTKERAIKEMTEGGYNYHSVWRNLLTFIEAADISVYRQKLGLTGKPKPRP